MLCLPLPCRRYRSHMSAAAAPAPFDASTLIRRARVCRAAAAAPLFACRARQQRRARLMPPRLIFERRAVRHAPAAVRCLAPPFASAQTRRQRDAARGHAVEADAAARAPSAARLFAPLPPERHVFTRHDNAQAPTPLPMRARVADADARQRAGAR